MTNTVKIFETLKAALPFDANKDQLDALSALATFIQPQNEEDFFILTGPAGSGKTSLNKALVDYFNENETAFYLASPTGRSAQLLAKKTNAHASTLHKLLFHTEFDENSMQISFIPKNNYVHEDARCFIIDEASMISDKSKDQGMFIQNNSVLAQLIRYAKKGNPANKIIFIGDRYQLPPIDSSESPALSVSYIASRYQLKGRKFDLNIVERQKNDSYILAAAGEILASIKKNQDNCTLRHFRSISSFSASINKYLKDFQNNCSEHAIMIAFANSQVNALNTWARKFRYNYKNHHDIMPGELLISNNNCMIDEDILSKGNHFSVNKTWKAEEFAGLHFINAEISFESQNNEYLTKNTKILLESISSHDGNIPFEAHKNLIHEAFRKNKKFRESKKPSDDAFVNAIRARYGYALTCHKAQGGEWKNVYLHPGYRKDNLRWLYTAVTRASEELFSWSG
jgi:exodeoxyribonuclease V